MQGYIIRHFSYLTCELDGSPAAFLKHSRRALAGYQDACWLSGPVDIATGIHIEKIVVRQDCRGRGNGRALYERVTKQFPLESLHSFVAQSPCANTASTRFHEALGFHRVATVPYELADGSWFLESLYVLEPAPEASTTGRHYQDCGA